MVQREVGERLAAHAGDEAYGIPSVKVAYWADADVVGKVPARTCSSPTPGASPPWCASCVATRPRSGRRRHEVLVRLRTRRLRSAPQDAARLARRPGDAGAVRGGRESRRWPSRGARRRGVGPAGRRGHGRTRRLDLMIGRRAQAPAKVTLSLRITGVRDDGYHLIDAEMVTVDLCDGSMISDGDRLEIVGTGRGRCADRRHEPRAPGARPGRADKRARTSEQAHPAGRRARRRLEPMRRRSCGGPASTTSSGRRRSVPTFRSACSGVGRACRGR